MGSVACAALGAMPRQVRFHYVYNSFHSPILEVPWHVLVWSNYHPPRCSFVAWLACRNRLPTKERVSQYAPLVDVHCVLCGLSVETQDHLFFECPFASQVVKSVVQRMCVDWHASLLRQWIKVFAGARHKQSMVLQLRGAALCSCIYQIWEVRNRCLFAEERITVKTCMYKTLRLL